MQRTTFIQRLTEIERVSLGSGDHESRKDGLCVMEAAAYIAGEVHTDTPSCVCPVVGAFLRSWNDGLQSDADRDRLLKPLLTRILDSQSTPEVEQQRSYLALDWLVRVHAPAFLRLRPELRAHADALSGLAPLRGIADALAAKGVVDAAMAAARAAAVVGAAAGSGDAAWAAARAAAGDAAWAAARAAAVDAVWASAWAAAGDALAPTVAALQQSALDLVERMLKEVEKR
jgi:hypothetical protein